MSGLKVSFPKSVIFCCVVSNEDQSFLAKLLGVRTGTLPVKYLEVPLVSGKLKDADCKPFVDKITARVQPWTARFLSHVGRGYNSFPQSLQPCIITGAQYFSCQKKVIEEVKRICCAFCGKGEKGLQLEPR